MLDEIAHRVVIDREAEACFCADLVALGDSHVSHVVGKACEFRALPVVPRSCHAHPRTDAILHFRVRPVTYDHLAVEAHASVNESCLPVAMGSLVQIHEVHINLAPRQVAVELRMQVQERLAQGAQPANPHF